MDNAAMHIFWIFSLLITYVTYPVAGVHTTDPSVKECVSPSITNGTIQFSDGNSTGSVATFICNEDFYINGTREQNTTSECLASGNWSDPTPSCISKVDELYTYYICGNNSGYLTHNNGEIVSHSGFFIGQDYSNNITCISRIEAPSGMKITLVASTFDLEAHNLCSYDSLELYDGNSVQAPSLGKYCNGNPLHTVSSTEKFLTIQFKTDGSNRGRGFDLHYYFTVDKLYTYYMCGNNPGYLTHNNGEIVSHSGFYIGQNYTNDLTCTARIEAPSNMKINLVARTFDLEAHDLCSYDSLEIYDGNSVQAPSIGKYCNGNPLHTLSSTGRFLTIRFKTDGSKLGRGFVLHYNFTVDRLYKYYICGNIGYITQNNSGIVSHSGFYNGKNYSSGMACISKIEAPLGMKIILVARTFDLEADTSCSYDFLKVYDGNSVYSPSLGIYCYGKPLHTVSSTERFLTIQFITDGSISGLGFDLHYYFTGTPILDGLNTYYMCGNSSYITQNNSKIVSHSGFYSGRNYSSGMRCISKIEAPFGMKITLVARTFDLEAQTSCSYDYLEVYDGNSVYFPSLGTYCNGNPLHTVSSTERFLTIQFVTDGSRVGRGFELHNYFTGTAILDGLDTYYMCGNSGYITQNNSKIVSHSGFYSGRNYSSGMNCISKIEAPLGMKITLIARTFDLEAQTSCGYDYLEVYDGNSVYSPRIGKYCNGNPLHTVSSTEQFLTIQFVTDSSVVSRGFELHYYFTGTAIQCVQPNHIENGWVYIVNETTYNESFAISCDHGYYLVGDDSIECLSNGSWSIWNGNCTNTQQDCSTPEKPINGFVQAIGGFTVDCTAIIACDKGYELIGESEVICLENGLWSDAKGVCVIKECSVQSPLAHGRLNITSGTIHVNSTASVICDTGYVLNGLSTVKCTQHGILDTSSTRCVLKKCSLQSSLEHGRLNITTGTIYVNSTVSVICDPGYIPNGSSTVKCTQQGILDLASTRCVLKKCSVSSVLEHGMLNSSSKEIYVNDTASVVCDPGYVLDGSSTIVCTADGQWDISLTACIPRNCGRWNYTVSSWAEFSYITYSPNTTFGSTAISFCRTGFQIINSTMKSLAATCTSNGTWSVKSPPLCVAVECPLIQTTENITITYSNGKKNAVNSTATFKCDDPQSTINGYERVTCLSTGKWTGPSPKCVKIEKLTSPCPAAIDYRGTPWKETQPGQITTVGCREPEVYTGEISRQCSEKGQWKLPAYNCVRKDIDTIDKQIEAIKDNPSEEVVTDALDKLNDITKPTEEGKDGIFSGEIEKVTSILDSIADISLSAKTEVTNSQAEAFLSTTSNLLDTSNTESWKSVYQSQKVESEGEKTSQAAGAAKILDVVSRYSDAVTASLKNSSNSTTTVSVKNLVLHVTKVDKTSNGIMFPKSKSNVYDLTSSFHLPKESLKGVKHVSSVLYKNLTGILSSRTTSNGTENQEINSAVVAVKIENWEQNKKSFHLTLTFGHFQGKFKDRMCSFWNEKKTAWDDKGCILNLTSSSSSESICECYHLTNFAILISPWEELAVSPYCSYIQTCTEVKIYKMCDFQENVDTKAIDIISTVGCSISLVALVITIIAHIALWRYVKSDRVVILINLSIALVISYAIFLGGVDSTENKDACTAVAVLLQYIYLVVFFLMLAEGIEISVTVLYIFTTASRLKWLLPAAWLIPAVIVGISLGATQLQGYGNEQFCWLSVEGGLIWAFVAPAFTIILVNFVLLVLILRAALGASTLAQKSKTEKTKAGVKCLCVLLPLMGCTWVIGIFYVNKQMAWIQYVFAVCNSLQGLVIFLFHCAINKQIRMAIERRRKKYASSFLSTVSSTKRFSMPRASTTSSHSDRVMMSGSISRDEASFKSKNNFERNNSERNNFEMISSRSRDSPLLQKRL